MACRQKLACNAAAGDAKGLIKALLGQAGCALFDCLGLISLPPTPSISILSYIYQITHGRSVGANLCCRADFVCVAPLSSSPTEVIV